MIPALALVLAAAAPLADDVPAGTDLVLRLAAGELTPELKAAWNEAAPLVRSWPQLRELAALADGLSQSRWLGLARACGVELGAKGVTITLAADLDAPGGPVSAAFVRGAKPKLPAGPEYDERLVEGERAIVARGADASAAVVGGTLVLGDERGVQRLVRHLRAPRKTLAREPVQALARALRRETPVMLAVRLTPQVREGLRARLAPLGHVLAAVGSATLSADAGGIDLVLAAERPRDQDVVTSGARAFAAALSASASGLLALGELTGALRQASPRTQLVPAGVDAVLFTELATGWLRDFRLTPAIRPRRGATEVRLEVTSYRGLGAAALVLAGAARPSPPSPAAAAAASDALHDEAETLLFELREAELAYAEDNGELLPCAAEPAVLPRTPVPWRASGCFAAVGFAPEGLETVLQLEALVRAGELLLVARADPDGDGVPTVWLLDETADTVRLAGPGGAER